MLANVTWAEIEKLRERIGASGKDTVEGVAQHFASVFSETFSSVALARVFIVLPFGRLPEAEKTAARASGAAIDDGTRVLSLLGTRGREPAWNDRRKSAGHRAIPLVNREFVQGAPMIAKLLSALEIDLQSLDNGAPIATRKMLGGHNGTFYVQNASSALDDAGRHIIPGQDFVKQHDVKTVFGMGGAYIDGTLAIAILFTTEALQSSAMNHFPSLISTFKMSSAAQLVKGRIFAEG